jgi:hypothetical protein
MMLRVKKTICHASSLRAGGEIAAAREMMVKGGVGRKMRGK